MLYMRFEFDEEKLYKNGINLKGAFSWLDRIATKCKLDKYKVDNGYYESKSGEGFQAFMNIVGVLSKNDNIAKYCNKWEFFDDEEAGLENLLETIKIKGS